MRLSELPETNRIAIRRDGEFASLGLLSHDAERLLVVLYDARFLDRLPANPHVACVVTSEALAPRIPENLGLAVSADPKAAFYEIHERLLRTGFYWTDFDSQIASDADIHPRACVAPRNVRIGPGTRVEPGAVILDRCVIGRDAVVRAGAVVGGEGFEPKDVGGRRIVVPHAGGVRIGDRVELQANCHVARAVFGGFTEVGDDTKVDALVHIAHNVRIGRRCEIAASAMIAGSTTVGDDVWIGPSAVISSELTVGDGAFVALGAVAIKNVAAGAMVAGLPARLLRMRSATETESGDGASQ